MTLSTLLSTLPSALEGAGQRLMARIRVDRVDVAGWFPLLIVEKI